MISSPDNIMKIMKEIEIYRKKKVVLKFLLSKERSRGRETNNDVMGDGLRF